MKKLIAVIALLTILVVAVLPVSAGEGQRYVVVFNGNGIPKGAASLIEAAGGSLVKTFPQVGIGIVTSTDPAFADSVRGVRGVMAAGAERFHALPDGEAAVAEATGPDPVVDDRYFLYQWDIRRVGADLAWEAGVTGSHDTVVAILDTGIAWNHPDLAPNVVYHTCYTALAPTCQDYPSLSYHATHVAGTVAAAFGGAGAVGVGPNLGLASYNVFELYNGGVVAFDEALWEAMLDVADKGYDVINMSLGGYIVRPESPADLAYWTAWNRVADYVTRQGVTIVASAGNGGVNLNGPVSHVPGDISGIINVGGTSIWPVPFWPEEGVFDFLASYSNTGAQVTLVAPGGDYGPGDVYPFWWHLVYSDYVFLDPTCAATESCPVGYAWAGGTSMASPHVAGAAGLVKDANPGLNPHQITSILKSTAQSLGDRQLFGHGMLDVFAAVSK